MTPPFIPARRPRLRCASALLAGVVVGWIAPTTPHAASPPPARGRSAMVVSVEENASRAGLEVLRGGGNAIDATIAVAFTLAVTHPQAGNLGGGGFLLYRRPDGSAFALDFREVAPRRLRREMFLGPDGRPDASLSLAGGLAVGVPGSVAGLFEAHRRWGTRRWAELLRPAARLARRGFAVPRVLAEDIDERAEALARDPGAREVFFDADGIPLREGARLVQKRLASTIRRIAARGPDGFYRGPVARGIRRTVERAGGVMDAEDLLDYRPVWRSPLEGSYRGRRVLTFPPPSSGGVLLLQMLGMLEAFDLAESGFGSSLTAHRMAEVFRRAYADRARWLGDPDFFDVPVRGLLDPHYIASRRRSILDERATESAGLDAGLPERAETTHFSVVDRWGNAVALTTTLNSRFGAAIVAEETGVLLNNEIDDFALAPGVVNQFGLTGGEANALEARKRPLSSMCPTIVEAEGGADRPALVLGSPGGSTIITTVLQVIVNVLDHGMDLQEAVDAPRFHHQWLPDRIEHEPRAFAADVAAALERRGHRLALRERLGQVCAIGSASDGREWTGAADSRRGGLAAGH